LRISRSRSVVISEVLQLTWMRVLTSAKWALGLLAPILLTACEFVVSRVPAPDGFVDPSLTGLWCTERQEDGRCEDLFLVTPVDSAQQWISLDEMATTTSSVVARTLILNWRDECTIDMPDTWDLESCNAEQEIVLARACVRGELQDCVCTEPEETDESPYGIVKYQVVGGELYVWPMAFDTVDRAIEDGTIEGEVECGQYDDCVAIIGDQAGLLALLSGKDIWEPVSEEDEGHTPVGTRVKRRPLMPLNRAMACIEEIDPAVVEQD
jgi:hypothetical protein